MAGFAIQVVNMRTTNAGESVENKWYVPCIYTAGAFGCILYIIDIFVDDDKNYYANRHILLPLTIRADFITDCGQKVEIIAK